MMSAITSLLNIPNDYASLGKGNHILSASTGSAHTMQTGIQSLAEQVGCTIYLMEVFNDPSPSTISATLDASTPQAFEGSITADDANIRCIVLFHKS